MEHATRNRFKPRAAMLLAACTALPCAVWAQGNPHLADSPMAQPARAAQPAVSSAAQSAQASRAAPTATGVAVPVPQEERVGDVTHRLLAAQASGVVSGQGLPMLGATATLAYQRYLDSFTHKIPTFFETRVQAQSNGGGQTSQ